MTFGGAPSLLRLRQSNPTPNGRFGLIAVANLAYTFAGFGVFWLRTGSWTIGAGGRVSDIGSLVWFGPTVISIVAILAIGDRGAFRVFYDPRTTIAVSPDGIAWWTAKNGAGRLAWANLGGVSRFRSRYVTSEPVFTLSGEEAVALAGPFKVEGRRKSVSLPSIILEARPKQFMPIDSRHPSAAASHANHEVRTCPGRSGIRPSPIRVEFGCAGYDTGTEKAAGAVRVLADEAATEVEPIQSRRSRVSAWLLVAVVATGLALPGSAFGAPGQLPTTPAADGEAAGDFKMNLYRKGDHVPQYTQYWCIGASMQMMLNIVGVTDTESRKAQERYMRVARSGGRSPQADDDVGDTESAGQLRGAGSGGWARGLVQLGAGGYYEGAADGYTAAVRAAAKAIRSTGRPVGMIVWRGRHAWVMTGFTATADPLVDPKFRVTGVYVQDPWYPRVSSIWGPGQKPNQWLSVKALKSDFLPRRLGWRRPELAGKFIMVLPVDPVRPAVQLRRMV